MVKLLHPFVAERLAGTVMGIDGVEATVSLPWAGFAPTSLFGRPVLRGEIGEFLIFARGTTGIFGRITSLETPRAKRPEANTGPDARTAVDVVGTVQLLGTLTLDGTFVRGVARHPRVGDLAYAADEDVVRAVLGDGVSDDATLDLGVLSGAQGIPVGVSLGALFGRHLAVVGSTGGGKSWTLAALMERSAASGVRTLLLDATGEFEPLGDLARHLVVSASEPAYGKQVHLPHRQLSESDRRALLRPSGASQLPKMRAAIRSLRLVEVLGSGHSMVTDGLLRKANNPRKPYSDAVFQHASIVDDPRAEFNLRNLADQIRHECVYETSQQNDSHFGGWAPNELGYCNTLIGRVYDLISTPEIMGILDPQPGGAVSSSVLDEIDKWVADDSAERILRISLADITFSHNMREIVVNTIGRHLLSGARRSQFRVRPLVVAIDEAHQFFGQSIADELVAASFDSFDLIAKEGRKYGLVVCMATQRPGDLPAAILSQAGALLVHRLTERRDRERVEHAASELTASATRQLPALMPGEALLVGSDFAIPVPVHIAAPQRKPDSRGPVFG
ncbi:MULTISPECIES: ATP-binding protein [Tsukamurella]|uniref:ATP-binding protein n=1 Tax=Tsukamurella asaccharolytica TaxID=2592067 RepID=A0A5C5R5G4_9ACTN|nr:MULTISPECIES: ATP-binding protein [Tsukamurella]TWS18427.1 ATP-binding protein [Tsukamurella asaccharolytica]